MSFLNRIFGKKPAAPKERPPINEDWRVGDLAVCIIGGWWQNGLPGPEKGDVCRVTGVYPGRLLNTGKPVWGLTFAGWSRRYDADLFRKTDTDHEAADAEFTALIRKRKPVEA